MWQHGDNKTPVYLYKGGFIGFFFSSKSTPRSYYLHLLSLSSLALLLSTLLAISTRDVETSHFHRYKRRFPCTELAFYRSLSIHTYHRACILLFTIHTCDVCTYHGHRILSFTVCTRVMLTHTIAYCQCGVHSGLFQIICTTYIQSMNLIFNTIRIPLANSTYIHT